MRRWWSGLSQQTVNLSPSGFVGSNPTRRTMVNRKLIIGVMGPGSEATEKEIYNAFELGKLIASEGWIVLTGGINSGVMESVSKGAKEMNGLTIGIIPKKDSQISEYVDIPIRTDIGSARNIINILTSDIIVVCGMGPGTSSEVSFALQKWANKPVIILDGTELTVNFFKSLNPNLIFPVNTVEEVINKIKELIITK
jgi:uncharacterized protein (TIGR00725 family)